MTSIEALFEELVVRWTRAEPLDVDGLLERAGTQADELAHLIDAFLERAPRRGPSPEARKAVTALAARLENEPPLVSARVAARRRVRDLTQALTAACGLPTEAEDLVRSYYQRLESGLLDPRGVSDKVWDVLEKIIGVGLRGIALDGFARRQGLLAAQKLVFQRLADSDYPSLSVESASAREEASDEIRREVARLFTGRDV
jgi:AcrR family transcriptional regulator